MELGRVIVLGYRSNDLMTVSWLKVYEMVQYIHGATIELPLEPINYTHTTTRRVFGVVRHGSYIYIYNTGNISCCKCLLLLPTGYNLGRLASWRREREREGPLGEKREVTVSS